MRSFVLFLLLLIIPSTVVFGQSVTGFIEEQIMISSENVTPQMNVWMKVPIGETFGIFTWSLVNGSWAESYIGPTVAPTSWLKFGVAGGVETVGDVTPFRYGSFAWVGNDYASLLFIHEDGKSGPWHRAIANFNIWTIDIRTENSGSLIENNIGVGAISQRFLGVGPRLEINNKYFKVWGAVLIEKGGTSNGLVSLSYNF